MAQWSLTTTPILHTRRTLPTGRIFQVYKRMLRAVVVDFDAATQSLAALNAAAYRLVGTATCLIEQEGTRYLCRITPNKEVDSGSLRSRFIELVTDENLRERLAARTEPVRNLLLSLAFGSLAERAGDKS